MRRRFAAVLFTLHQRVAKTQTDMCRSTFEISAAQLHYVTETASKSLLLNVNGISIRLGFRVGHKSYLAGSRGIV